MVKFVLQMSDDKHSTQTMMGECVALKNSEYQLNKESNITEINSVNNIVASLIEMIKDYNAKNPTDEAYKDKLALLQDEQVMKCIIKNVGPHGFGDRPYKIYLAAAGDFEIREIAHVEELDENNKLTSMNRLFVIIPENNAQISSLKKIKFWNANFEPKEFKITASNIFTYTYR